MPSQAEIRRLKQQVADSSRILDHQGLVDFHGHVSARIPGTNRMLIKPVLKAHNQVTARDLVEVDLDAYAAGTGSQWDPSKQSGRVIDAPVPPRETMLHVAIMLARPDVGSVVHTHQLIATSIGAGNVPIKPLYNQALPFAPETPIFPHPRLITSWEDGKAVADCLGDRTAALLRGHGVVVVGQTVDHSVSNTIYLERAAIMQVVASIVGTPMPLTDEYVAEFGPRLGAPRLPRLRVLSLPSPVPAGKPQKQGDLAQPARPEQEPTGGPPAPPLTSGDHRPLFHNEC